MLPSVLSPICADEDDCQRSQGAASRKPLTDESKFLAHPSRRDDAGHQRISTPAVFSDTDLCQRLTKDDEILNLQELAHVVRLSKYQERKRVYTRFRLQTSLISTALSARLQRCGDIAHRNLVECFRRDDKDSFVMLYNAVQDVRKSCDQMRRWALQEPDMDPRASPPLGLSETPNISTTSTAGAGFPASITPFLHEVSASARKTLLGFLTELRTNPDYLATRICSLSSAELNAFLTFHKALEPVESVLPFFSRSAGRQPGSASIKGNAAASNIQRLLSFQRHDPLSILIHSCFANSAGPESAEDQRRLDIWATTLVRLVQQPPKSSGERFIISVLSIWTTMRDWSGQSNMEWYLMKILEDGAFILDRAEDQYGTRFNLSDWKPSDEAAAEKFYDQAVVGLFELIDNEDAAGIPEGLLELGNAVLDKLDDKYLEDTSRWLVWRCLFFVFLLGVIVHPESYGMLAEYHITPYAREKILKKVAMKAHEFISSTWSGKPSANCSSAEVPPEIKRHIESILARFRGSQSRLAPARLLPAKSITSLRETIEVRPYLVLSPSDLVTLVDALFPKERTESSPGNTLRSGTPSTCSLSTGFQQEHAAADPGSDNADTASLTSTIISSAVSDGTSIAHASSQGDQIKVPLLQNGWAQSADPEIQKPFNLGEDDSGRLQLAIYELKEALGSEIIRGQCHPCAEKWAVMFISPDGRELSTTLTCDSSDEMIQDDKPSGDDPEEDSDAQGPDVDRDLPQLRDAISRLVEEYDIPCSLGATGDHAQLTNRASQLRRYKSRTRVITPEKLILRTGPYSKLPNKAQVAHEPQPTVAAGPVSGTNKLDQEPLLIRMLRVASAQSEAQSDYLSSLAYWKTLQILGALEPPSLRENGFAVLIRMISRSPRKSIQRSTVAIEEYDAWLTWIRQGQERHDGLINDMMGRIRAMRDKMWFVSDVRNSKEYIHSRDICQALRTMGTPQRGSSARWSRSNSSRAPGPSFLSRADSQIINLLAAPDNQGGSKKLSDEQVEMTNAWLRQHGIENFCRGEERIHRFCLEVDKCVSRLVGETIRDAPVLWSSDLFKGEEALHDHMRAQEKDLLWGADDAASTASDGEKRPVGPNPARFGWPSHENRSFEGPITSQHGVDSSRISIARPALSLSSIVDRTDFSENSCPFEPTEPSNVPWSPFGSAMSASSTVSRVCSPNTSLTNLSTTFSGPSIHAPLLSNSSFSTGRPGTSGSLKETAFQQRAESAKTRFLAQLRRTVTSLLLSDLGRQVLSRGSDTDTWFRDLGQQCIERKDSFDRRAQRKSDKKDKESGVRNPTKPRVIEKKKSFSDLRGAGEMLEDQLLKPSLSHYGSGEGAQSPRGVGDTSGSRQGMGHFSFKKAYHRLLNMFSVHPSPFAKLKVLNELEKLIVVSLTWDDSREAKIRGWNKSRSLVDDGAVPSRGQLDGTIVHVEERQCQARRGGSKQRHRADTAARSTMSAGMVSTDVITSELQRLFRDAAIRPKTLFRDLQVIAAFVPSAILDRQEHGKAFWTAGLAALKLKSEVCLTMVEMADDVIAAHTLSRKSACASDKMSSLHEAKPSLTGTPPPPSTTYTLDDIGKMWTITAKEGFPTAQRELALFYLSNPECVEQTILPLSRPRDVFKQTVMDKYGKSDRARAATAAVGSAISTVTAGSNVRAMSLSAGSSTAARAAPAAYGNGGDVRNDVGLMCVAVHWMEAAEQGGDELATSFLRQNEFMGLA